MKKRTLLDINRQANVAFLSWASHGHAEGRLSTGRMLTQIYLDTHSLFARDKHGLNTDDFTSAAPI